MAFKITEFFAKLTFKLDSSGIDAFERNLRSLENRIMSLDKRLTGKFDKLQKGLAATQLARKRELDISMKEQKLHTERIKSGMKHLQMKEKEVKLTAKQQSLGKLDLSGMRQKAIFERQRNREDIAALKAKVREERLLSKQSAWQHGPDRSRLLALRDRAATQEARAAARAEARSVRRSSGPTGGSRSAFGHGFIGGGMGAGAMSWGRGFIPGLGGAFAIAQTNRINQEIIGQQLALNAVTGGAESGAASSKWLRGMTGDLGINYRAVAPSYTKMLASGQSAGWNEGEVRDLFTSMSEYGRVLGLDSETMKGSMRSVEQMLNKGQIMAEELKNQLGERFPAAMSLMAQAASSHFGRDIDNAELLKLMEDGKLSSEVLKDFTKVLHEQARKGGQLEAAMKSSAAQQGRFNNAFTKFIEIMGKNGFEEGMQATFMAMTNMLQAAEPLAENIGKSFKEFAYTVEDVFGFMAGKNSAIGGTVGGDKQTDGTAFFGQLKTLFQNLYDLTKMIKDGWTEIFQLAKDNGFIGELTELLKVVNRTAESIVKLRGGDVSTQNILGIAGMPSITPGGMITDLARSGVGNHANWLKETHDQSRQSFIQSFGNFGSFGQNSSGKTPAQVNININGAQDPTVIGEIVDGKIRNIFSATRTEYVTPGS